MRWRAGVWLVLFCLGLPAVAAESKLQRLHALSQARTQFARAHGMSAAEVDALTGEALLNGEAWVKGGVGVVNRKIFIEVDAPVNAARINGVRWQGAPISQTQVLMTDGDAILKDPAQPNIDMRKAVLLIFTPQEVRFLRLYDHHGARYLRPAERARVAAARACQAQAVKRTSCPSP